MAIDVGELSTRPLDSDVAEELDKFEEGVRQYLAGEIDEDVFRVFRLNNGIYGQRQQGHPGQERRTVSGVCAEPSRST